MGNAGDISGSSLRLRLSLRARVRVAFADREIDVEGGMEGAFCLSNQPYVRDVKPA